MSAPGDRIVGRGRELAALRAWLDAARQGTGRLVLCAGEPGIGKTRLAQELAGIALAGGTPVAWGRCVEAEGAPPLWPWRQVLRSLAADPDTVLAGDVESPQERFRLFESVIDAVRAAAGPNGLLVVLDDVHWSDEPSLLVLRHLADNLADHLADHLAGTRLLVVATFRDVEPAGILPRVLPDLLRAPAVDRLDLQGFGLAEVREQLGEVEADAGEVLDLTGGNPLFVREVARSMAEGTWRPDRPPRSVLDIVTARLDRVSPGCRRLVQAAAIAGRDFSVPVVAATLGEPAAACLPLLDEAVAHGLVDQVGPSGEYRFVHALTREAVEASLTTSARAELHRAVAGAIETQFAGDLSEHLTDLARHWAELAPYGEAATARRWTLRAADDAVRRLAYEEGARLYTAALAFEPGRLPADDRGRILIA
ncbi:MAG: ATP-binding protein, partial [Acidimicrobiales bacterium]